MSYIIICGEKNWHNYESVLNFVKTLDKNTIIMQGGREGVDALAKQAARECGISCITVPIRPNLKKDYEILNCYTNLVVAFHSNLNDSEDTKMIVEEATKSKISVKIFNI